MLFTMGDSASDESSVSSKFAETDNYKSAFARSVATNARWRQVGENAGDPKNNASRSTVTETEVIRLRKECQNLVEENRRLKSIIGGDVRTSSGENSKELPVENFVLQSQVDTLQWQLQQAESSRNMYRAVMDQMVCFLERTHRSLDLLHERLRPTPGGGAAALGGPFDAGTTTLGSRRPGGGVPRSRSVHHVSAPPPPVLRAHSTAQIQHDATAADLSATYSAFKDFTWRRAKRPDPVPEEISPEKLSQEAFRLLRTAQSLLNTREPDLVHIGPSSIDSDAATKTSPTDQEFMMQLAREFPPQNSLKVVVPEVPQIATAFNRKLSLHRTLSNSNRNSTVALNRDTITETDFPVITPSLLTTGLESDFSGTPKRCSIASNQSFSTNSPTSTITRPSDTNYAFTGDKFLMKEKSQSPHMGSVSSAEDESGFSSMSSFQEIGLPMIHSTFLEKPTKNPLLAASKEDKHNRTSPIADGKQMFNQGWFEQEIGLPSPENTQESTGSQPVHRRWRSNPVDSKIDPLRVLWV